MTVLCEVEAIVNKRPVIYLSEEHDQLVPLSLCVCLQEIEEFRIPHTYLFGGIMLQSRFKHRDNI